MKFYFNKKEDGLEVAEEIVMVKETLDVPGIETEQQEIASAIAMALQMFMNHVHEEETVQHAIQNSMKAYSAWGCKSHLLRQQPFYLPNLKRKA